MNKTLDSRLWGRPAWILLILGAMSLGSVAGCRKESPETPPTDDPGDPYQQIDVPAMQDRPPTPPTVDPGDPT